MRAYCLIVLLAVGALGALPAVAQTTDAESTSDNATISRKIDALQKQIDALKAAQATKASSPATKLTISGTTQVWLGLASHPETTYMKTGGIGMRFRRSEIHFDGVVDPTLSYHLNIDAARPTSELSPDGYLQDIYLQYNLGNGQSLLVGQTKLPLSLIGPQSSGHLMTIERPLFVLGARGSKLPGLTALPTPPQWGDVRDPGVQYLVNQPYYSAQIALTEGAGDYQNAVDNRYGMQVTAQFKLRPAALPGLQIGLDGSDGAGLSYATTIPGGNGATHNFNAARIRGGASLKYIMNRLTFQSEYMAGIDGIGVNGAGAVVNASRHGEYGVVGYDLTDYRKGNGYQAVAMADYWDAGAGNPRQTNYIAGINHDMDGGRRRLQIEYVHEHYGSGSVTDSDGLLAAAIVNW